MKTADVLLLYTEIEREQYVNMGFSPSNCFATNNCIDQLPIVKASEAWPDASVERFRRESGLEGRDVFLFCGRVTAKSRLAICVQALRHLVEAGRDPVLVIIGEGSEVEALKREARLRGVTANLYWIGALYDQATLAPWFRSSISLVYPGAIGLSLIHSFGYALPVITHGDPIDHMPEFAALKEGFNGLLFEKGCPEDLARKMLLLAENKGLRRRLSENSFRTVQDEFSFDGMVERFRNALEKASEIAIAAS
jgi:glycosyltransferase involved in cell wall biosynthesis